MIDKEDKIVEPSEIIIETETEKKTNYRKINPWQRFLARFTDYSLLNLLIIFLRLMLSDHLSFFHFEYIITLQFLLWVPIEAFLLSKWGYTPGKFLLKTKVKPQLGKKLDFSRSIRRSFSVWVKGIGLGIPVLSIFVMLYSYFKLKTEGITSWDKEEHTHVIHEPLSRNNIIVSCSIILLSVFLTCIFSR